MSNVTELELVGSTGQLDAVTPRDHLPDDWSGKGACPVCRTPGQLRVWHHDDAPDQMVCDACGTVFQVEMGGARVRLAAAPPPLATSAGFLNVWLTLGELWTRIDAVLPDQPASPSESPAPSTLAAPVNAVKPALAEPLAAKAAERVDAIPGSGAAELEPGTDDWFASLAAAIGGLAPVTPPTDDVLADELERVLAARASAAPNGEVGPAVGPVGKDSDPAPSGAPEPTTRARTSPLRSARPDSASPDTAVLAGPDQSPGNGAASSRPGATLAPAVAVTVRPVVSALAPGGPRMPAQPATEPTRVSTAPIAFDSAAPAAAVSVAPASMPAPAGPPPNRHELADRAWQLHELGNSLASIQSALEASQGAPEDVAAVMGKLTALEQARRARFRRNLQITVGGGLLVLLVLLVIAALITLNPPPTATPAPEATLAGTPAPGATDVPLTPAGNPTAALSYNPLIALLNKVLPGDVKIANGPSPTPAPPLPLLGGLFPATPTMSEADLATADARKSSLPSWVATLVPSDMTVLNGPTPSVDNTGPAGGPCPTTAAQASALFGGPAASWTYNRQQGGWIFILANNPTTIRVPANMSAGYLAIGANLEMRSAVGPATIHNVNFAALSCGQ